MYILLPERHKN